MRSMSRIISFRSIVCLAFALAPSAQLAQAPATAKNPASPVPPAAPQDPSPMVEHTRTHPRLTRQLPPGDHYALPLGTLFIPQRLRHHESATLLFFFHGGDWLPELAASRQRQLAVVTVQAGAGSGSYVQLFQDPTRFLSLVAAAESASRIHFGQIALGGWSAGCGAIRQILPDSASYQSVHRVLCIDSAPGYAHGTPGPLESDIDASNLQIWLRFGRDAMAGQKRLIITHSEIFPRHLCQHYRNRRLAAGRVASDAASGGAFWPHGHTDAEPGQRRRAYRDWVCRKFCARPRGRVALAARVPALAGAEQIAPTKNAQRCSQFIADPSVMLSFGTPWDSHVQTFLR